MNCEKKKTKGSSLPLIFTMSLTCTEQFSFLKIVNSFLGGHFTENVTVHIQ